MSDSQLSPSPSSETEHTVVHLPRPTAWPLMMAGGVTLLMGGFITSPFFSIGGVIIFGIALGGWIKEIRHENAG